jgi:cytochrome c oxidase subunit 2
MVLIFGLGLPAGVFFSILAYSVSVGQMMGTAAYKNAPVVEVTGKQWWWRVRYLSGSDVIAETANEIHMPAGVPMKFKLQTTDVIHSFWVPNLSGKMDMIPGRTNEIWIRADREGVWRGECAEFCGAQHAHMQFEVIAENPDKYSEWLARQKRPAEQPVSPAAQHGMEVFVSGPCVMCHTVRGTPAAASAGPDLTHVAGRRKIAAGTLANTRGHLGAWIVNAQGIKPGSRMPRLTLEPGHMDALVAYLETLR